MDTISFCTPCLKWKFILAYKDHHGFNGFTYPFSNKYLHARYRSQSTSYDPLGRPNLQLPAIEQEQDIDRITGEITTTGGLPLKINFFEAWIRGQTNGPNWSVSDDYFRWTNGAPAPNATVSTIETWLSEPYTLEQLDGDIDARINAVNPDDIPWSKLKTVGRIIDPVQNVIGDFSASGPEPETYIPDLLQYTGTADGPVFLREALWDVPFLRAAAWYIYVPNLWAGLAGIGRAPVTPPPVSGMNYNEPGFYIKLVGFFSMAGKYAEQTQYLDFARQPYGPPGCVPGRGVCGNYFKILPPPLDPGRNAIKILQPNKECA